MQAFHYQNHLLFVEEVSLADIASEFGTPCYVYSREALEKQWDEFDKAFSGYPHRICYAVKANSNIGILNLLAKKGSGFDIVSQGELERVLAAGGEARKTVFSGVGKTQTEILRALEADIFCFNVESEEELVLIDRLARQVNKIARIALRLNPNIDALTHPYISTGLKENKFGIDIEQALPLCRKIKALSHLQLVGIGSHIGSQLVKLSPFLETIDSLIEVMKALKAEGMALEHIDIGGGLGVIYQDEDPPTIREYLKTILKKIAPYELEIIVEPGRAIIANAGILLTRVEYIKPTAHKNFAIVDAGMNDLIRPALYQAWQDIIPVQLQPGMKEESYDVVGPVCESADFLGKDRQLSIQTGDLLAVCSAGAYGFSMSSNYNSRPRVAEILVDGDKMHVIRERETIQELFAREKLV